MNCGKLLNCEVKEQIIYLNFERLRGRIEVITPRIVNVFAGLMSEDHRSKAIEGDKTIPCQLRVEKKEDGLWIFTTELSIRVCDDFLVDFYDQKGELVCADYRGSRTPLKRVSEEYLKLLAEEGHRAGEADKDDGHLIQVVKAMTGSEHFYGLGDKTGYLDKRHYDYEMWNTDNPDPQVDTFKALYKSIPFFITLTDSHVYGLFFDNTYRSWFNMGQESEEYFWFGADKGNLDYYYIAGENMPQVLSGYTYLTGTTPLPQKWTLGYHQSRWGYVTQEDVQEIADGMRDNDIPCDSIHLDIDYMRGYRDFTWDLDRYHDDPEGFLARMADRGFKMVCINDAGVKKEEGYEVYDEGVENGYFAKMPEGDVYINAVWPGEAAFPDFGNPKTRIWWADKIDFLVKKGIRGVWNDMNEPASFKGPLPDDVVFTDEDRPTDHTGMHNVYGHLMSRATYEGLKKHDGRRPFVITRACYAGSQKYTMVWTGDNTSMWGHLQMAIPQLCNLGLSGMPFAGTDIGGFGADTTPELLARWIELGALSPFCRNHSAMGSRRQEPWVFGDMVLDIYRKYVKLRYRLIPYFYDLFFEGERTGAPIMRPLVYEYEKDETARTCNDEFLIGSRILAAPVVQQGADHRMVYLPQGQWYDYWTGEKIAGSVWFVREAPLDVCPLYVKAGTVLPCMPEQSYVGEKPNDTLILQVFPGEGEYDHYLDNGEDFDYREGKYHQYHFTVRSDGTVETQIVHAGYEKPYEKILMQKVGNRK
ncbi:MAG: glycoside hydrolase family 31 protein [Lachnospiraceae bacterium]|nr:glycoside hydrolase family 31 protein [Lachnospiraceae bacterium]